MALLMLSPHSRPPPPPLFLAVLCIIVTKQPLVCKSIFHACNLVENKEKKKIKTPLMDLHSRRFSPSLTLQLLNSHPLARTHTQTLRTNTHLI